MAKVTIQDLMDAGVHYGHQTKRWNPKMRDYIHGERNGIYIFDLTKTMIKMQNACKFVFEAALNGGEFLFVGTKRQAQETIKSAAETISMHYVCERWLGGTLTNSQTIRKSITRMKNLQQSDESGELAALSKKEASSLRRKLYKLRRDLWGISNMRKIPEAIIIVDVHYEDIAVREAKRLNIPVIGIVDTNSNPDSVDYVIPGNDDAHRSIKIIVETLTNTIKTAQDINFQKLEEEKKAELEKAELEKAEIERAKIEKAEAKEKSEKKAGAIDPVEDSSKEQTTDKDDKNQDASSKVKKKDSNRK